MDNFAPARPRLRLAIAAAIMSAITMGSLVAWPSLMRSGSGAFEGPVAAGTYVRAPTEVAILPSCIEVIGVRDRDAAMVLRGEWLATVGQREGRHVSALDASEQVAIQGSSACGARPGSNEWSEGDKTPAGAARGGQARRRF